MENNENLVTEEVAENVEQQTTEEIAEQPKTYTEAEFNAKLDEVLGKRIARKEAKIRKEYERKYGDMEYTSNVLKAGLQTDSVEEATDQLAKFYADKGRKMPQKPNYSARDVETLARADAEEIIQGGYDEVVEEVERLKNIGAENMTARDRALFKVLAEHRQTTERSRELAAIGVTEELYNSKEFQEFASDFNPKTPIERIYNLYKQTLPKKEIRTAGSMKQSQDYNGPKEYYSPEEIDKLTEEDLDDPVVWEAVRRSMTGR